jgi:hypothetical protein
MVKRYFLSVQFIRASSSCKNDGLIVVQRKHTQTVLTNRKRKKRLFDIFFFFLDLTPYSSFCRRTLLLKIQLNGTIDCHSNKFQNYAVTKVSARSW